MIQVIHIGDWLLQYVGEPVWPILYQYYINPYITKSHILYINKKISIGIGPQNPFSVRHYLRPTIVALADKKLSFVCVAWTQFAQEGTRANQCLGHEKEKLQHLVSS